jgi:enoyl-CoA hydratase/carnithine racemase
MRPLQLSPVNRVVPADQALTAALNLAMTLAGVPVGRWLAAKHAIDAELALQAELASNVFQTDDRHEGMATSAEKRPPRFYHG